MRIVLGLAGMVLAACFTKPARPSDPAGDGPTADGWLQGWDFRKRIEIHPGITGMLAEFPIAIARTDPDIAARSRSGRDLVVTEADGTSKLAIELAAFDDAGKLELWTRIPELTDGTTIYLYYGGDDQLPSTAVWDGLFQGVWHLSNTGTAARDSSTFTNHMTTMDPRTPASVEGVFGNAVSLDGVDDSLSGGDPPNGALDFGSGSFSYSMWVFQDNTIGEFDTPFYKGGPSADEPGYCWLLGDAWTAKVHDSQAFADADLGIASQYQGRWVHLVAVVDRGSNMLVAYADGVLVDTGPLDVGDLSTIEPIEIGRSGGEAPFRGLIDEVRIYNAVLAPDWIRAEHANGLDPDFLDVGLEEQKP